MSDIENPNTSILDEIDNQADDIASKIIEMLVNNFKAKTGKDPSPEEIGELLAELTEDRINELLNCKEVDVENDDNNSGSELESESESGNKNECEGDGYKTSKRPISEVSNDEEENDSNKKSS